MLARRAMSSVVGQPQLEAPKHRTRRRPPSATVAHVLLRLAAACAPPRLPLKPLARRPPSREPPPRARAANLPRLEPLFWPPRQLRRATRGPWRQTFGNSANATRSRRARRGRRGLPRGRTQRQRKSGRGAWSNGRGPRRSRPPRLSPQLRRGGARMSTAAQARALGRAQALKGCAATTRASQASAPVGIPFLAAARHLRQDTCVRPALSTRGRRDGRCRLFRHP